MPGERPLWPRWARNLFVLQLLLNVVAMVSFPLLHFSGQAKDHVFRLAADKEAAACKAEVEKVQEQVDKLQEELDGKEKEMLDWWAIDTRNLRAKVAEDVEELLRQHSEKGH